MSRSTGACLTRRVRPGFVDSWQRPWEPRWQFLISTFCSFAPFLLISIRVLEREKQEVLSFLCWIAKDWHAGTIEIGKRKVMHFSNCASDRLRRCYSKGWVIANAQYRNDYCFSTSVVSRFGIQNPFCGPPRQGHLILCTCRGLSSKLNMRIS